MLDRITPVILTLNESPNVARCLERLAWARDIVVLDSLSQDDTVATARRFPQVRVFERRFDTLAGQWNHALDHTGIASEWVLALDADYMVPPDVVEELAALEPDAETAGYRSRFGYQVLGRPVRASLYPPVTVLFRRGRARYRQDGHAHRVVVDGRVRPLRGALIHDDRKPLRTWLATQDVYMRQESAKLLGARWSDLTWPDRLRRAHVGPLAVLVHTLLVRGAFRDGRAGLFYVGQRVLAETLLSLYLLERSAEEERRA